MSVISSEITIVRPGENAQSLTPGFCFQDGHSIFPFFWLLVNINVWMPGIKYQAPSTKYQINFKYQCPKRFGIGRVWDLVIGASLEFGAWILAFPAGIGCTSPFAGFALAIQTFSPAAFPPASPTFRADFRLIPSLRKNHLYQTSEQTKNSEKKPLPASAGKTTLSWRTDKRSEYQFFLAQLERTVWC